MIRQIMTRLGHGFGHLPGGHGSEGLSTWDATVATFSGIVGVGVLSMPEPRADRDPLRAEGRHLGRVALCLKDKGKAPSPVCGKRVEIPFQGEPEQPLAPIRACE